MPRIKLTLMGTLVCAATLLMSSAPPAGAGSWDLQDSVATDAIDVVYLSGSTFLRPDSTTPADTQLLAAVTRQPIGVTWGQWEAGTASSRVRCNPDGSTDVRVALSGLIPNSVYSLFYRTFGPDSYNVFCPNDERASVVLTCLTNNCKKVAFDSHIITDANGQASVLGSVRTDGCLLSHTQVLFDVIYHFDGQTYGQLPNRREFDTQLRPCTTDADCASGDVCLATGLGFACQPTTCTPTDTSTCRECQTSYGIDAIRQTQITQKSF